MLLGLCGQVSAGYGAVNSDSLIHPTRIEAFKLLTEEDVRMLIASSKSTSCCLDPYQRTC